MLFGGCVSAMCGESLAGVAAVYLVVVGVAAFVIPGALLWRGAAARWPAQVLPAVVLGWLVVGAFLR